MAFGIRDNHGMGRALTPFYPDAIATLGLISCFFSPTSELRDSEQHQGHPQYADLHGDTLCPHLVT